MKLNSILNTSPHPFSHQHHNRRSVLVAGSVLLVLVVIGAIIFQWKNIQESNKREIILREQYQAEQAKSTQASFAEFLKIPAKPTTEEDQKQILKFFEQSSTSQPSSEAEIKKMFDEQRALSEKAFTDWKAAQSQ